MQSTKPIPFNQELLRKVLRTQLKPKRMAEDVEPLKTKVSHLKVT